MGIVGSLSTTLSGQRGVRLYEALDIRSVSPEEEQL